MKRSHLIALPFIALLSLYVESVLAWPRALIGAQIATLPALVIFAALRSDFPALLAVILLGSLWRDALSADPLGLSLLPLAAVGAVVYSNRQIIVGDQFYARFMVGAIAGAAVPLLMLLQLFTLGREPLVGWFFPWQLAVMAVGSGLLVPLYFRLVDWLEQTFLHPVAAPNARSLRRNQIRR
ncbi:MAG: hypothetical protein EXS19_02920 [Pedosphaera sp.]|nr:hypothetical protein [Pedosphaera sp.]MSU27237.1 hypothetical protein [Pedosphaera sp.]